MYTPTASKKSKQRQCFKQENLQNLSPLRQAIATAHRRVEAEAVRYLLNENMGNVSAALDAGVLAKKLVTAVRKARSRESGVDALMKEFSLSSEEGVALMCLAEALLRIPDKRTADRLISDKLCKGDWRKHLNESPSLFVSAATWALVITGKLVNTSSSQGLDSALTRLIGKGGEPLIRRGVGLAMRMLGNQFVTGKTIDSALKNSRRNEARGYRYSYDMLGEAAMTDADATQYFKSYQRAIHAIGNASAGRGVQNGPGISIKLSALYPRYTRAQREMVMDKLLPRLLQLVQLAAHYDIGVNIDAEESERLELSLDLMEALAFDSSLDGFKGIGFVVQAYQKRSPFVLDFIIDLARRSGKKFMIRLVKGAYWDAEIKRAQVDGMIDYPVYTRKAYTDVSYLVCASRLLANAEYIYPQFATHNAHSVATIYSWACCQNITEYEFQCLHGMGETLYDQIVGPHTLSRPCRIYAPVGSHETLLPYLVRRILENGANSSFVNQIVDKSIPISQIIADPLKITHQLGGTSHPEIPLPKNIFGLTRLNSSGIDFNDEQTLRAIERPLLKLGMQSWEAKPLIDGLVSASKRSFISNPAKNQDIVGYVINADEHDVETALHAAVISAPFWMQSAPSDRALTLRAAAQLFEDHRLELMALLVREAGKSLPNAVAEVREAVDFLRYYAEQINGTPSGLALGPIVCISPWNFPLAIFVGEVSAALAAGNVVLAKPAEQTPLIAFRAVQLMHQAGVPLYALQFIPGGGSIVGGKLVSDRRTKGVIFTGSTEIARLINRTLAQRLVTESCEIPLIAETGGQNAMIVDSSALPEQVVQDVISSAFDSAGQRCSALRILCLQDDIADKVLGMLKGAIQELHVGIPDKLSTDVGPVIDASAQRLLLQHVEGLREKGRNIFSLPLPVNNRAGTFVPPTVIEINSISEISHEVFGPILHVIRYKSADLVSLIAAVNATGYGLTLGIHSRINGTIDKITRLAHVGNIYVNRDMVGAVVGVQPFGGEGKSGTGPKAGGPLFLKRLQRNAVVDLSSGHGYTITEIKNLPCRLRSAATQLISYTKAVGNIRHAELGELYLCAALGGKMLEFPGPTGESNCLLFKPRGKALCISHNYEELLNQILAILATGNEPIISIEMIEFVKNALPQAVIDIIQVINEDDIIISHFHIALICRQKIPEYVSILAARDGALMPIVVTNGSEPIPVWRLYAECAISINTTAAGGNASLMAASG